MSRPVKAIIAGTVIGGIAWAAREWMMQREQEAQIIPATSRDTSRPSVQDAFKDAVAGNLTTFLRDATDGRENPLAGIRDAFTGLLDGGQATGGSADGAGAVRSSTGGGNYAPLLNLLKRHESGGNYNAVWGRIAVKHRPANGLTRMTIGEVLAWQDSIDQLYNSEAAGAYQILEDTLRGLYRNAGLNTGDRFDVANQDRLAIQLLRRRGLSNYEAGRITDVQFAQNLSMEWASLPAQTKDKRGRPATGQSYYAGDGLNRSLTSKEAVLAAVRKI